MSKLNLIFSVSSIFFFVFQEARHIVVALLQHVTYNEFLPMVLGKEVMHKYGVILQKEVISVADQSLPNP